MIAIHLLFDSLEIFGKHSHLAVFSVAAFAALRLEEESDRPPFAFADGFVERGFRDVKPAFATFLDDALEFKVSFDSLSNRAASDAELLSCVMKISAVTNQCGHKFNVGKLLLSAVHFTFFHYRYLPLRFYRLPRRSATISLLIISTGTFRRAWCLGFLWCGRCITLTSHRRHEPGEPHMPKIVLNRIVVSVLDFDGRGDFAGVPWLRFAQCIGVDLADGGQFFGGDANAHRVFSLTRYSYSALL